MDVYDRMRLVEGTNAWHEKLAEWQAAGTVRAALSTANGALQAKNELLRIESTHTAVTRDAVKTGERLRARSGETYDVTYVIPGTRRRLTQVFLKAIQPPEGAAENE